MSMPSGEPGDGYRVLGEPEYVQYKVPGEERSEALPVENGRGVSALLLGILSIPFAFLLFPVGLALGIAAVVLGARGRRSADALDATNKGSATTGVVLGVAGIVLSLLVTLLVAFVIARLDGAAGACQGEGRETLRECVDGTG